MPELHAQGSDYTVLSSDWTGLSPFLIAIFYPVERVAAPDNKSFVWRRVANSTEVRAPITDGTIDSTVNWNSPFENTGVDQKFSSFSALLQSGGFANILQALSSVLPDGVVDALHLQAGQEKLLNLVGRSSVTKLNSTQIFNGLPPIKVNFTVHFRATTDPYAEVRRPMDQLMQWGLPQYLEPDGVIANAAKLELGAFKSKVPQIIAMQYADMLFSPMVIESQPYPLTAPRDSKGRMLHGQMNLSLASLTSIDANDWINTRVQ